MTFRAVQWTTGNVGKRSVRAVAANPELELMGCYAWSPEKVGIDVDELVRVLEAGVKRRQYCVIRAVATTDRGR